VLLPILLAWLALGLTEIDSLLKRRTMVSFAPAVTLVVMVSLTLTSPLWTYAYQPNNFTGHAYLQFAFDPKLYLKCFQPVTVPEFYRELGRREPGSLLVVEAPWYFHWHSFAYYQMIHRQRVMIGFVDTRAGATRLGEIPAGRSGITFANTLHVSDHELLRCRDVRYVIFHKRLTEETRSLFGDQPVDIDHWVRQYTVLYGPPVYDDDWLTVFDVQRPPAPVSQPASTFYGPRPEHSQPGARWRQPTRLEAEHAAALAGRPAHAAAQRLPLRWPRYATPREHRRDAGSGGSSPARPSRTCAFRES